MKCIEYGIQGEKNIIFELKNSHMPMYILQDLYLQDGELSAQIDFLVITRKMNFVIECKNLYGDIKVNSNGDFIRTMTIGTKRVSEGIYSPITQNERHLQLMKKMKRDKQTNFIMRAAVDKLFDGMNKSIVVLANPKTVLNTKEAPNQIKDKVIRADQLVNYIKQLYNVCKDEESSDKELLKRAESYLNVHQEGELDYTAKYDAFRVEQPLVDVQEIVSAYKDNENIEETMLYQALKKYRLEKSREEKVKPYFIYNNNELNNLMTNMPSTLAELKNVQGFGEVKVNKYGEEILAILNAQRRG
jgi:superfamily II DNA helicase RecQ